MQRDPKNVRHPDVRRHDVRRGTPVNGKLFRGREENVVLGGNSLARLAASLFLLLVCLSPSAAILGQDAASGQDGAGGTRIEHPSDGALGDTPWFDAETSSLIPVEVDPEVDDTLHRDSRWLPKAKQVRAKESSANSTAGGTGAGGAGTGVFGSGFTIGNLFGWVLLAVLVAIVIFTIAYLLSKSDFTFVAGPTSRLTAREGGPDEQTLERMKHLPPELRRTDVNLRSEAERLMREGSYDQAIILLFAHQLLLLDRAGVLRLNRGKTNRRYVRETRSVDRDSAERLQGTVTGFERSYFGGHSIRQREFAQLWRDNELLEEAMERRQEVAA